MQPHEKRVVDEKLELDTKISNLSAFLNSDIFASLPPVDQGLLMVQVRQMKSYSETLGERIERFATETH